MPRKGIGAGPRRKMVPDNAAFSKAFGTRNLGAVELPLGDRPLGKSGNFYPSEMPPNPQAVGRKRKFMNTHVIRGVLVCGVIMLVTGCSHHYRVDDLESGRTYYTKKIHEEGEGAVEMEDERTGSTVRLQSSEVTKISEDVYEAAVKLWPPIVIQPPVATEAPAATQPAVVFEP